MRRLRFTLPKTQSGQILITMIIVIPALILIVTAYFSLSNSGYQLERNDQFRTMAQMTADAGADYAIEQLNQNTNWTPPSGETVLKTDGTSKTTYAISLTNVDSSNKTLTITGRTYFPATASTAKETIKLKVDMLAVNTGTGSSSVATGIGGLILSNNAKISGGDVVVDGTITLGNNSQIGLSTNPVNVRVADQACPVSHGSGYPRVCSASQGDTITNPITMGTTSRIYADVIATNQTSGTNMTNDGLQLGQTFAPVALPTFDRTGFKSTVNASGQTMTAAQAATCSGGVVNWPANVKITGNVTTPNNCTAKINGNVWITGSLALGNNAKLAIQNSVGTTTPNIVIDGSGGMSFGNNSTIVPNSSNTGPEILTFWSADAGCSPDCTTVTGTNLYTSQNTTTINLSNNGSAPRTVLYAYWSKASISNNGALGAVAGQTVSLSQNAVITFTASVPGSNNIVTTWVKKDYSRVFN